MAMTTLDRATMDRATTLSLLLRSIPLAVARTTPYLAPSLPAPEMTTLDQATMDLATMDRAASLFLLQPTLPVMAMTM
ncbi:hypothetical protein V8F33_004036 [Rhypophila sp. PSN 637]